jgi:hypothetical protein
MLGDHPPALELVLVLSRSLSLYLDAAMLPPAIAAAHPSNYFANAASTWGESIFVPSSF